LRLSDPPLTYSGYITVGDFNGDGKLDLAIGGWSIAFITSTRSTQVGQVQILLGNGDGTFQPVNPNHPALSPVAVIPSSLSTGDFNGDGKVDLAVPGNGVYMGRGDGNFDGPPAIGLATSTFLVVGEFNGDGATDLAVGTTGTQLRLGQPLPGAGTTEPIPWVPPHSPTGKRR